MASDSAFGTPTIRLVKPVRGLFRRRYEKYYSNNKQTWIDINAFPASCRVHADKRVNSLNFLPANWKTSGSVSIGLGSGTVHRRKALQVGLEPRAQG